MLGDGFMLGMFTLAGFAILFQRLPKGIRFWCIRHPLIADLIIVIMFYSIMGFTLMAHFAAAFMTLGTITMLHIARYPERYTFIHDAIQYAKDWWDNSMNKLSDINEKYKANKAGKLYATQSVR